MDDRILNDTSVLGSSPPRPAVLGACAISDRTLSAACGSADACLRVNSCTDDERQAIFPAPSLERQAHKTSPPPVGPGLWP